MEERLYYLGKCKPKELKQYFDRVYEYYKDIAAKKGFADNEIKFIQENKWIKCYVKTEIEI